MYGALRLEALDATSQEIARFAAQEIKSMCSGLPVYSLCVNILEYGRCASN